MAINQQPAARTESHGVSRLVAQMGRVWHGGLDLLYPPVCVSCGDELALGTAAFRTPICPACLDSLELIDGPACGRCSAPLPCSGSIIVPPKGGCFRCAGRKLWFDATIAAGEYAGRLRQLVLQMKPASGNSLSLAMGQLVVERCRERLGVLQPDVVVPVPMHWMRRISHGTNSAAIVAEVLAGHLRVPRAERLLKRLRNTPPQFSLTPPQRWENVRRVFSVRGGYYLTNAHVVLVDDILTTGATCSEAARCLRKAGAKRVTVVVVARSLSNS